MFFAYHPQFLGEMYLPCTMSVRTAPPEYMCFRLDKYVKNYTFLSIPRNCTSFFGTVSVVGNYDESQLMGQFDNLKLIIGQLHIGATLLDRLDRVFPKLEVVYPYYFEDTYDSDTWNYTLMPRVFLGYNEFNQTLYNELGINDGDLRFNHKGVQYLHARINRFLTNMSIPTLLNIRPLDIGDPVGMDKEYNAGLSFFYSNAENGWNTDTFLPATIDDPCIYFPQFSDRCGSFIYEYPEYLDELLGICDSPLNAGKGDCADFIFKFETYIISLVSVAFGLLFSCRAMILLLRSKATKSLPYSRLLLLIPIAVSTMTAVENGLVYQKAIHFLGPGVHFLPQFESLYLFHPASQWILRFLAASRHTCLAVIIFCYVDILIFTVTESRRISVCFCTLVLLCFPILTAYLSSQIHLEIRGIRPLYSREPRQQLIYIPFIMNINFTQEFINVAPKTTMLIYDNKDTLNTVASFSDDEQYLYNFKSADFPLESSGQLLPEFSEICDIGMIIAAGLFFVYSRTAAKFVSCRGLFELLLLLYFQLSINRIRFFIHNIVLTNDFCNNKDYEPWWDYWLFEVGGGSSTQPIYPTCFDVGAVEIFVDTYLNVPLEEWDNIPEPYTRNFRLAAFMTKYQWDLIERLFEALPYIFFLLVSHFCYRFAKFHNYLSAILHREEMRETTKEDRSIFRLFVHNK